MPDRLLPDDEVTRLMRADRSRIHNQPTPLSLEARDTAAVFSYRRVMQFSRGIGLVAVLLTSALGAVVVLAFHNDARAVNADGASQAEVHITRSPGLLVLPILDRTIGDPALVARLATDIRTLPAAPTFCRGGPSYDTSYTLTFMSPPSPIWIATIQVFGCDEVNIGNGSLRQVRSPALWSDLAQALDLTSDELRPLPCVSPGLTNAVVCYPESGRS
jgi:hypothetical protein